MSDEALLAPAFVTFVVVILRRTFSTPSSHSSLSPRHPSRISSFENVDISPLKQALPRRTTGYASGRNRLAFASSIKNRLGQNKAFDRNSTGETPYSMDKSGATQEWQVAVSKDRIINHHSYSFKIGNESLIVPGQLRGVAKRTLKVGWNADFIYSCMRSDSGESPLRDEMWYQIRKRRMRHFRKSAMNSSVFPGAA